MSARRACMRASGGRGLSGSVDPGALPPARIQVTADGAWIWFVGEMAVFHEGTHRKIYAGYVDSVGTQGIASYDLDTQEVEAFDLRATGFVDDHANAAVHVRQDGRIQAIYSRHNDPNLRSRVSTNPEDISAFDAEFSITTGSADVSYPTPVRLSAEGTSGRLYVFFRDFVKGGNAFVTSDDDGATWSANRVFFQNSPQRPYFKVIGNGVDTIHVAVNHGHPNEVVGNDLFHFKITGGNYRKTDGTLIRAVGASNLVTPADCTLVYATATAGESWVWDVQVDGSGHPVIVYAVFSADHVVHTYRYARWNGTTWLDYPIVGAGTWISASNPQYSGGIVLVSGDTSKVFLSRQVSGQWEIEKWATADGGATWARTREITTGSGQKNVRPVAIEDSQPGDPDVMWMRGSYVALNDYDTALVMAASA